MSTTTLFGIYNGIYSINELHKLGMSINKPESIILTKNNEEFNGLISNSNNDIFVSCTSEFEGYISIDALLALGFTIKPQNYCLIYVKPNSVIVASLTSSLITYTLADEVIRESLSEFYSHTDRIIIREVCTIYDGTEEIKAYKDDNVIVKSNESILDDMVFVEAANIDIDKYEITRKQYKAIMNTDPSSEYPCTSIEGDERPVDNIELSDAIEFCNKLSIANGLIPYYNDDLSGLESTVEGHNNGFRLPTVNEWTEAALAGTTSVYSGTDGSLPQGGNNSHQLVFTSEPVYYEMNDLGDQIPVYDETSTYEVAPTNTYTNPDNTSIANVGDPELAKYAWTKFNIRTGECENVPQPPEYISEYGAWKVFKYNGIYYKSNAYGQAAVRGDVNDHIYGTHTVGTRLPNALGLYDMTGNASEITLTNGNVLYVGGDAACNTSKLYIGHPTYECKIKGLRICRNR